MNRIKQARNRAKWENMSHMLAKAVISGVVSNGKEMLKMVEEDPVMDVATSVEFSAQRAGIPALDTPEEKAGHRLTRALTCTGFAQDLMVAREAAAPGVICALEAMGEIIKTYQEDSAAGLKGQARRVSEQTFMKASNLLLAFYRSTAPKITSTSLQSSGEAKSIADMSDDELLRIAQGGHIPEELLSSNSHEAPNGPGRPRSPYTR